MQTEVRGARASSSFEIARHMAQAFRGSASGAVCAHVTTIERQCYCDFAYNFLQAIWVVCVMSPATDICVGPRHAPPSRFLLQNFSNYASHVALRLCRRTLHLAKTPTIKPEEYLAMLVLPPPPLSTPPYPLSVTAELTLLYSYLIFANLILFNIQSSFFFAKIVK